MLSNIFKQNVVVTRKGDGSWVDGVWVESENLVFTIKASVHPVSSQEMQLLPEGYRNQSGYVLYSNSELRTASPGNNNPDVVKIGNVDYVVLRVEAWENTHLSHFRILVGNGEKDVN